MIGVGDQIPDVEVFVLEADGPVAAKTNWIFSGRRVAVFGVPGAFTRTCSARHLPGFIANAESFREKGVDEIYCLAVNDVFVLAAWAREHGAEGKVGMLSDGSLNFTRAAGLEVDLSARGFGPRCRRFSMLVDDGVVTKFHVEPDSGFGETSAEVLLAEL